jgi:hypothetical protein
MNAAYLNPGGTATITAISYLPTGVVVSSDPSVVAVPPTFTAASDTRSGTFTVTAVKPGESLITVNGGQYALVVTVAPEGTRPRWPGGVTLESDPSFSTRFDHPVTVTITPSGRAPFSGASATGTVVITSGAQELARVNVAGTAPITVPLYPPSLDAFAYLVHYSGDANFFPQVTSGTVNVTKGRAGLTGALRPLPGPARAFSLAVTATGSPVAAPTGRVSIRSNGVEIASLPLSASVPGEAVAETTLTNLPASPTLTVHYDGDALYTADSQQVRTVELRKRAVRH